MHAASGGGGEEQVFHYVVERFDDDVVDDRAPGHVAAAAAVHVDAAGPRDDHVAAAPAKKTSGQHKGQTGGAELTTTTDEMVARCTSLTESQVRRRIADERLWNVMRSPGARYTTKRFNR